VCGFKVEQFIEHWPRVSEGFCWSRTGERQASVLPRKYLRDVLRQEVGSFDTSRTHIAEVVNSVYNDTLSEKLCFHIYPSQNRGSEVEVCFCPFELKLLIRHYLSEIHLMVIAIVAGSILIYLAWENFQVPNFSMNLSNFVASYAASLYLSWRLALVSLPQASLLILGGLLYGREKDARRI
jgi:ATP-binding cassette subfamily B (MDR/TAP) protein 1